ncbi:MAG: threonine synthase, partial [Alphaproteobacteria bacterium]
MPAPSAGFVSHLECSHSGERLAAGVPHNLSPQGWPLLVRYDLEGVAAALDRDALRDRPQELWRYRELLP